MRQYGEFIYDGGSISESNKIHQIPNGFENVVALRDICQVTSRALFQWIVSDASRQEARAKGDPDHRTPVPPEVRTRVRRHVRAPRK
jgi:hypothetical protein